MTHTVQGKLVIGFRAGPLYLGWPKERRAILARAVFTDILAKTADTRRITWLGVPVELDDEDMIELALEEAELFAKDAEKNLEASFARQLKATEDKITQAELEAVKEVKIAAAEAAVNAATAVLETQLKAGKHAKLVDNAIKDLDKRLN